jgi:hypothetical protein
MIVSDLHQRNIALSTLKMSKVGAMVAGGMNHKEAVDFLLNYGIAKEKIITLLKNNNHSDEDIADMF